MPKERKPGWVKFENGAMYSPEEIKLLTDNNLQTDRATHRVKTLIGGEIVGFEKGKLKVTENVADTNNAGPLFDQHNLQKDELDIF